MSRFYRGQLVYRTDVNPGCWTKFVGWMDAEAEVRTGVVEMPDGQEHQEVPEMHLHDRAVSEDEAPVVETTFHF